jgi:hypothetical protein
MTSSKTMRLFALTVVLLSLFPLLVLAGSTLARAQQPEPQGNVLTPYGQPVGAVDEKGIVTTPYGSKVGSVDPDGNVYNVSGIFIGRVYPNGDIFNQAGDYFGYVDAQGDVYNVSGFKVGSVQTDGNLILAGGAARIIFFKSSKGVRHKPRPVPLPR